MIGKIKLSREQSDAIIAYLKKYDIATLLNGHACMTRDRTWTGEKYKALNGLDQSDMARALLIGYYIEESFEVGDWLVLTYDKERHVRVVMSINTDATMNLENYLGESSVNISKSQLRHATEDEVKEEKEIRVWRTIGRKYREIKIDDAYTTHYDDYTITNETDKVKFLDRLDKDRVVRMYPIESAVYFDKERDYVKNPPIPYIRE